MSLTCKSKVQDMVIYEDQKPFDTNGGTFSSGSWVTRQLNTVVYSRQNNSWASQSLNQFTLQPGTYLIEANVPAYRVNSHQIRLQNITNGTTDSLGISAYCSASDGNFSFSEIMEIVTIDQVTTYEIQHRCQSSRSTDGLGIATFAASTSSDGTNVYTQVIISKLK